MTLIWFWKAKRRRGSKKERALLYFLFLVELQHIGFPRAAVRTSLLRALQLIRQVSIRNNVDLPPALGGDGLDEPLQPCVSLCSRQSVLVRNTL